MIGMAWFAGMAKPIPMLPPLGLKMAVVHTHDLTVAVEQRAAGVAAIDGRVDLQEVVVRARVDVSPARGNDAGGDGAPESERAADRDDPVANLGAVAVGEARR